MYQELIDKKKRLAVMGLGYVGLPIALEFAAHYSVTGYDINPARIEMLRKGIDPSREISPEAFVGRDIAFSADIEALRDCHFFVVAVPTPVDEHKVPDLQYVLKAAETIGKVIKRGDCVVFESTVYPGCTEEDCLPLIEAVSGLRLGEDFMLGYSPERINPGDKEHTIDKVVKIVSGNDAEALEEIAKVYGEAISAGVYRAPSIKVAEAAKVIENTQRDLNISFMNELAMIFSRMGIDTHEVIRAAGTKWNFLKFYPGLVGGHCIGIDPYYLLHKSKELGYDPQVILSGRRVNDAMPSFIAKKLVQMLIRKGKNPRDAKVLVMGITFKENVSDIRNSKVIELVTELKGYSIQVDITDPFANAEEVLKEFNLSLLAAPGNDYDAVVVAVGHRPYRQLEDVFFKKCMKEEPILIDIKGLYEPFAGMDYWRL